MKATGLTFAIVSIGLTIAIVLNETIYIIENTPFFGVHAGYIKTQLLPCCVQHGVVARAPGAKSEVIAHQYVFGSQSLNQYGLYKVVGCL